MGFRKLKAEIAPNFALPPDFVSGSHSQLMRFPPDAFSSRLPYSCAKAEQSRRSRVHGRADRHEGQRCLREGRQCLPGTLIFQFVYSDVWHREADRLDRRPPSASELKDGSGFRI